MGNIIDLSERMTNQKNQLDKARIYKFISGKGGVGKSVIAANLAYSLSRKGMKCLLVDTNYSMGSIDSLFGKSLQYQKKDGKPSDLNLSHVIDGKNKISEVMAYVDERLVVIPSGLGIGRHALLSEKERSALEDSVLRISDNYDVVLLDSPSGIGSIKEYKDIASMVLVVTPEPASISAAYGIMKALYFDHGVSDINILLNMQITANDRRVFDRLGSVARQYLPKMNLQDYGALLMDYAVIDSVKKQRMMIQSYPSSRFTQSLEKVASKFS